MTEKAFWRRLFAVLLGGAFYLLQGPRYSRHLIDRLPDVGDSYLNCWILAWDSHAVLSKGVSIWDAPIFYPAHNALAFSENMFGNLWLTLPIQWLTGNPALAANVLFMASFLLCMYCVYLLTEELTGDYWAGVIAGILFAFNPYRWGHAAHLQLQPYFWSPLAVLFALRFLKRKDTVSFAAALVCVWAQYYASIYLGTMLLTLLGIITAFYLILEENRAGRRAYFSEPRLFWLLLGGALLSAAILTPIAVPYLRAAREWHFVRSLYENEAFSAEPLSFLMPFDFRNYRSLKHWLDPYVRHGEGSVFVGAVPLILAAVGFLSRRSRTPRGVDHTRLLGLTAVLVAILMLGPTLILFDHVTGLPLPYRLLYYLLPGAKAMRAPARYFQPFLLCLSVLSGFGVIFLFERYRLGPLSRSAFAILLIGVISVDYALDNRSSGAAAESVSEMPAVYSYLRQTFPERPLLELPVGQPGDIPTMIYVYYQTAHWHRMLGGYSGWMPPAKSDLSNALDGAPSVTALRTIADSPAATVVIHPTRYGPEVRPQWDKADLAPFGFRFAGKMGDDLVWERVGR